MMGIQGAGKSSEVARYLERGYARLNRDLLGGDLDDLIPKLGELLASGQQRVILDNTYATRVSRFPLIRMAHRHGVPVRCRYLATPIHEAYANVVLRVLERYGRLLGPDDLKELGKTWPSVEPPAQPVKQPSEVLAIISGIELSASGDCAYLFTGPFDSPNPTNDWGGFYLLLLYSPVVEPTRSR